MLLSQSFAKPFLPFFLQELIVSTAFFALQVFVLDVEVTEGLA